MNNRIDTIKKNQCVGCYACFNICPESCIDMKQDEEGFLYPIIDDDKCSYCGLCLKKCPVINTQQENNFLEIFGCINKYEDTRKHSSSGGIFALLADLTLSYNGVVFGASFDNQFNVKHSSSNEVTIKQLQGSKYVQSNIGKKYSEIENYLKDKKQVLFAGTPCQIAGLKSFLNKSYNNLICVDFICHGVGSPKIWQKYLNHHIHIAKSKIQTVNFRSKAKGWKNFSLEIEFKNNSVYSKRHNKDPYMKLFLKNYNLRPACYHCAYKAINSLSDITLADFWGVNMSYPELNDNQGTSLVVIHNKKGMNIYQSISNQIISRKVNSAIVFRYNSSFYNSAPKPSDRDIFYKELNTNSINKLSHKYCKTTKIEVIKKFIFNCKQFLLKMKISLRNKL